MLQKLPVTKVSSPPSVLSEQYPVHVSVSQARYLAILVAVNYYIRPIKETIQ